MDIEKLNFDSTPNYNKYIKLIQNKNKRYFFVWEEKVKETLSKINELNKKGKDYQDIMKLFNGYPKEIIHLLFK